MHERVAILGRAQGEVGRAAAVALAAGGHRVLAVDGNQQ